jgi:cell division protein FtsL
MATAAAKIEYHQPSAQRKQRKLRKKRNRTFLKGFAYVFGLISLFGYIGVYAQVTSCGYRRAELQKQIRQAEVENSALRAEIEMLSSPGRLSAAAQGAGMTASADSVFIGGQESTRVAKAE